MATSALEPNTTCCRESLTRDTQKLKTLEQEFLGILNIENKIRIFRPSKTYDKNLLIKEIFNFEATLNQAFFSSRRMEPDNIIFLDYILLNHLDA